MEGKRLILHIEDDIEIIQLVTEILGHPQLAFMSAPDGVTGLRMAREHRPELILLDIMLPGMDGEDVFQRLRAVPETATIPVIMVTARSRRHEIIRAASIKGLEGYVGKPFNVLQLRRQVEASLGIAYQ